MWCRVKSTHQGTLKIGAVELECHVLENGKRVFSSSDLLAAFGLANDQKDQPRVLRLFLERLSLYSSPEKELRNPILFPIRFTVPSKGGRPMNGYMAELVPEICNAVLQQASDYRLPIDLKEAAKQSRILLKSFAKVGIIALVDEATGYQAVRDHDALRQILDKYLAESMRILSG